MNMWSKAGLFLCLSMVAPMAYANATEINSGDTAWVLVSTAFVLLMTIPGLALFYSGMVRKKNVLSSMAHSFSAAVLVSVLWVIVGYSLAFTEGNGFIGSLDKAFLSGISPSDISGTIPEILFVVFQMTFAIIAVAIISGSIVERMKFLAYLLFIGLWSLLIYVPVAHWIWGGGFFTGDALDFAGGTVIHINAGVAGLVAAYLLGKRVGLGKESMAPHNLTLTVMGGSLLWIGWFGFNGGSALAANGSAAYAILVTQVAAATAAISWLFVEYLVQKTISVLGAVSGAIGGLVVITPAAGFVDVQGALFMGLIGGAMCYLSVYFFKTKVAIDDSLDAFALHGIGGIVGAILTAFFTSALIMGDNLPQNLAHQLWLQIEGVLATIVYSAVGTFIILKLLDKWIGIRVEYDDERQGLDVSQHGERIE